MTLARLHNVPPSSGNHMFGDFAWACSQWAHARPSRSTEHSYVQLELGFEVDSTSVAVSPEEYRMSGFSEK